jgi:hypothetical protein
MGSKGKMARDKQRDGAGASQVKAKTPATDPVAAVGELRVMVRDARMRLTTPTIENLEDCRRRLNEAATAFERLQIALPTGDPLQDTALAAPLGALRAEIAAVAILLDGAAAFYTGWMRLASSMISGYTAHGTPPPSEVRRRVLLEV